MDTATLAALRGSIAKWRAIVNGTGVDEGATNCQLCGVFYYDRGEDYCVGCPVQVRTGIAMCCGTPYTLYARNETVESAQAELDFLISLLPEGETAEEEKGP